MRVHKINYSTPQAPVFQQQMPAYQSSPPAAPTDYFGAAAETFNIARDARQSRMHPYSQAKANRLLNRQPLNAAGFRAQPANPAPSGLFSFAGLKGLF